LSTRRRERNSRNSNASGRCSRGGR
jgi:hypothetical protein